MSELSGRRGVTVVIPTCRPNATLAAAVRSVLDQTLPAEARQVLICVNGGDIGYYRTLCERYADSGIEVAYTEVAGAAAGRNVGVRLARMPLITFLDDDDWLMAHYLERLVRAFEDPKVMIACGWMDECHDAEGHVLSQDTYCNRVLTALTASKTTDYMRLSSLLSTICGKVYDTDFFRTKFGKMDENLPHTEDVVFWAENFGAIRGPVAMVKDRDVPVAYVRRVTANSLSRPSRESAYRFFVSDRLMIIGRLAAILRNEELTVLHKKFVLGKIEAQTNIMEKFVRELPLVERERACCEIFADDNDFLNKSVFSSRQALAFCHNFPPDVDASAFVAAKRLRQIDGLEGSPLQWHVVSQDMSSIRPRDEEFRQFYVDFSCVDRTVLRGAVTFEPCGQLGFARSAVDWARAYSPKVIYSRSLFVGSHLAAYEYKLAHPEVRWYAEFSDPVAFGVDGRPRPCSVSKPDWFDVEAMVYEKADVIVFTNENQMEFMLGYNRRRELNDSIRRRALILRHPVLPEVYRSVICRRYAFDPSRINIGYFGTFYVNRSNVDLLKLLDNPQVTVHVFTPKPEELRKAVDRVGEKRLRVNGPIGHLDVISVASRMDYLFLNDTEFPGSINPFVPSKFADYLASGSTILAKVSPGSVLSKTEDARLLKFGELTPMVIDGLKKMLSPARSAAVARMGCEELSDVGRRTADLSMLGIWHRTIQCYRDEGFVYTLKRILALGRR